MDKPHLKLSVSKPVITNSPFSGNMGQGVPIVAPAYSVPESPLMNDTSCTMDDASFLMGGNKLQGEEIPEMSGSTEKPSIKNGVS